VEQSCVVDACNQSLLKYQLYSQGESKSWGMIVKGELALPMSYTSYQECGCHMNINRGEISNRAVLNSKGALALFYYFNSAGASLICFRFCCFYSYKCRSKLQNCIPTNLDTVLHSWLALPPLQALTLKVNVVSGLSPDSLVMTAVVVEPFTTFSPWKLLSLQSCK